jgi:hypothetical protein
VEQCSRICLSSRLDNQENSHTEADIFP